MDEIKLKRIATKISKCLALTASDNPEEAAAAKRQAAALMSKYNLTTGDIAASQVHVYDSRAGGKYTPPLYLVYLSKIIADAFGCQSLYNSGGGWRNSLIKFLGVGIKPELAGYTFEVLSRQLKKDRTQYLTTLRRYKRSNKTRMANLFCEQWVFHISHQVHEFAGTEHEKNAIAAYQQRYHSGIREDERFFNEIQKYSDHKALLAGSNAASNVLIHQPVQSHTTNKYLDKIN